MFFRLDFSMRGSWYLSKEAKPSNDSHLGLARGESQSYETKRSRLKCMVYVSNLLEREVCPAMILRRSIPASHTS